MTIHRMDHVGIVVDDLAAAIEFFVELGLESQGEWSVEGRWVDRIVGLEGVRNDAAFGPPLQLGQTSGPRPRPDGLSRSSWTTRPSALIAATSAEAQVARVFAG
jgi:catechol 2,3-dioxygenase-like lactoylglutathione lyase family enzyme